MFRNLILPALTVALLALVARNPAFTHDTMHKKILAAVVIVGLGLLVRVVIAAKRTSRTRARARELPATPRRRAGAAR